MPARLREGSARCFRGMRYGIKLCGWVRECLLRLHGEACVSRVRHERLIERSEIKRMLGNNLCVNRLVEVINVGFGVWTVTKVYKPFVHLFVHPYRFQHADVRSNDARHP
jgi:hypothetical protein